MVYYLWRTVVSRVCPTSSIFKTHKKSLFNRNKKWCFFFICYRKQGNNPQHTWNMHKSPISWNTVLLRWRDFLFHLDREIVLSKQSRAVERISWKVERTRVGKLSWLCTKLRSKIRVPVKSFMVSMSWFRSYLRRCCLYYLHSCNCNWETYSRCKTKGMEVIL